MPDREASPTPPPGMANRRNHYRVLHVQPEAPEELIKASYRTLMLRLKAHPDLGGSHAMATLINEAWAVLGDPERRAAYDRQLQAEAAARAARRGGASAPSGTRSGRSTGASAKSTADTFHPIGPGQWPHAKTASRRDAVAPGGAPEATPAKPDAPSADVRWLPQHCALCGQPWAGGVPPAPEARCRHCAAPLAGLPLPGSPGHELLGRRGASRRTQDHGALLRIGWPSPELPVRWRDLSLTGLSIFTPRPIARGQRIHLIDPALEAVAEVVACRPQGRLFSVHARLVTLALHQPSGVFLHTKA